MRVADSQIYALATTNTSNARARMIQASDRLASGNRITHPGEDPMAATTVALHRDHAQRLGEIQDGIARAKSEIDVMHGAIGAGNDIFARARELTVQMANDSYDASGRSAAADEVRALKQALISALNVDFGGRYLFSGHQTDQAPYDPAGVYQGDTGIRRVEVAPGVTDDVSIRADVYFNGSAGGVDIFTVLDNLEASLLANDAALIRGNLSDLDTSINQLNQAQALVGTTTNVLSVASTAHSRVISTSTSEAARLGETDLIAGSTELAQAQNALEAVLAASAKSFKLSLLDRL